MKPDLEQRLNEAGAGLIDCGMPEQGELMQEAAKVIFHMASRGVLMRLGLGPLWRPIAELEDKYSNNLLLCAPELVDLDCNEAGIGMGYWQDDYHVPTNEHGACGLPGVDYGSFACCKWNMTNDEWYECACTPTHFLILEGPMK